VHASAGGIPGQWLRGWRLSESHWRVVRALETG
jgi:hypothetical protein